MSWTTHTSIGAAVKPSSPPVINRGFERRNSGGVESTHDAITTVLPLTLRQVATWKEFAVPVTERLAQPTPALAEPQLVFEEVGDFAPSYTEHFTVYLLSEVWVPREHGFRTQTTRCAQDEGR